MKNSSRGLTLIEIAVVVAIAGVILVAALQFALPIFERAKETQTREKIARIEEALSAYAIKNFRIPCPAAPNRNTPGPEPFGYEVGSGLGGGGLGLCGIAGAADQPWGIVPYKTLGLPEDYIFDAWGQPFTFAVTNGLTADPNITTTLVHPRCRQIDWFDRISPTQVIHKNPRKARFCCAAPNVASVLAADPLGANVIRNTDVAVLLEGQMSAVGTASRDASNSGAAVCTAAGRPAAECVPYDTTDNPYPTSRLTNFTPPMTDQPTAIAYAIISHGRNGLYAFNLQTGNPFPPMPLVPSLESENNDGDLIFNSFIGRRDRNDALAYDDIVAWRTQDLIFAAQGDSCAIP